MGQPFFSKSANAFSVGRNNRRSFFLSVHFRDRQSPFTFEWHNHPKHTETRFVSVGWGHPRKHKWWSTSATLWVPDSFLRPLLRRIPAYVYRYGWRK